MAKRPGGARPPAAINKMPAKMKKLPAALNLAFQMVLSVFILNFAAIKQV